MNKKLMNLGLALAALGAATLACSLLDRNRAEPTTVPQEAQATSGPAQSGAVSSLEGVREATIQIEAQGTFVDPEVGLIVNAAGRGSGFIIDPSGLAVTNNHVVTGAALLQVWVGGESQPRNARILGVSECSDLALIDIDGDNYPYLDWRSGDPDVGLEVYAAGYPLGDPEYTLTKGIISKANADGETSWASVDGVVEHDARINPGNSGGPLVDQNGRVVGVNYATASSVNQYFAIKHSEAQEVLNVLANGQDHESIGVNGVAVSNSDGTLTGIWVSSVASGSPADEADVKPGDVITNLEGLVLATDGTMSDYCDIIRTHRPGDTLSIEVLRFGTGEYLAGQLNGRALETSFSFEDSVAGEGAGSSSGETGSYTGYTAVQDDFQAITVEVPQSWADVDGRAWFDGDDVIGASIYAAPDLDGFLNTWTQPGVIFNASDDLARLGGYVQLLDIISSDFRGVCELDGRYDYDDGYYRGAFDYFVKCGGPGGADFLILSAVPIDDPTAFLILVEVQILSSADLDAADRILATFDVVGSLP